MSVDVETAGSEPALSAAEPVAYVCAADMELLSRTPEGLDLSISPRPRPELGMNMALYAAHPAPSVAVKALEWETDTLTATKDGVEFPSSHYWTAKHHVPGLLLGWEISRFVDERFPKVTRSFVLRSGKTEKEFATLEEAKAAAQADYETRILSALSAQVQDVAGDEEWQTVPKHPTGKMIDAVVSMVDGDAPHPFILNLYRAMLAVAPAKQEGGE
ncbi:hypothetical protein [Rhizobium sp. Root651]|uniref:hypothetical protein n=1 Tax=Rhizobium sp. Root651 TaxID=1736577 RepID=UPI000714BC72|nr:hypothetical protein [Rhizobium sp. Root651]KRA58219.1 hypothetical protein ASD85_17220 [Rhizobium sp. Root651]